MSPDITDLPYPYTTNTRAGTSLTAILHVVASGVMGLLNHYAFTAIPTWLVVLPLILIFGRSYLYSLLTNAMHEALRHAENDSYLDEAQVKQRAEDERTGGLTPGFFKESLIGGATRH